jgi:hypothetical protein
MGPSSPEGAQLTVRAEDFFCLGFYSWLFFWLCMFLLSTYPFGMTDVKLKSTNQRNMVAIRYSSPDPILSGSPTNVGCKFLLSPFSTLSLPYIAIFHSKPWLPSGKKLVLVSLAKIFSNSSGF